MFLAYFVYWALFNFVLFLLCLIMILTLQCVKSFYPAHLFYWKKGSEALRLTVMARAPPCSDSPEERAQTCVTRASFYP
jgi:hypothetical protein